MKNTYRQNQIGKSQMTSVKTVEGQTMETMVARFMNNQTDIERNQPLIYTERREGVLAGYDIRTDRFEIALEAMDKSSKSMSAKRESKLEIVNDDPKGDDIQGTKGGEA